MKKKILLVEDEAILAMSEASSLEMAGFDVITAADGDEALSYIKTDHEISLVLMDIDLGSGIDGTETSRLILSFKQIPIIFLTSHSEKAMVEKVKDITKYGYVLKNCGEFVLIEAIKMAYELFEANSSITTREIEYREIVNDLEAAILKFNEQGEIIFFSRGAENIFGYKAEEVIGKKSIETINPRIDKFGNDHSLMIKNIFSSPDKFRFHRNENRTKDGTNLWMSWNNKLVKDQYGNNLYMLCIGNDLSDQKRARETLKYTEDILSKISESERVWQAAIESAGDGVWDWNTITNKVFFSKTWKNMLGYSEEEIEDNVEEWISRIHPDDKERSLEAVRNYISGITDHYESIHRLRGKYGKYHWILDRGRIIERDPEGRVLRMVGTHTDISAQKETEKQLLQLNDEKGFLLKEIHHRVKNNLLIISSLISLKEGVSGDNLADIKNQIDAIRIIHDKLYRGNSQTNVLFGEYCTDLLYTIFETFLDTGIKINIDSEEISIPEDKIVSLGLFINEIATNAVKYAFQNNEDPEFSVSLKPDEKTDAHILKINNNGPELPDSLIIEEAETLGMRLMTSLALQLKADLRVEKSPHPQFSLTFKL